MKLISFLKVLVLSCSVFAIYACSGGKAEESANTIRLNVKANYILNDSFYVAKNFMINKVEAKSLTNKESEEKSHNLRKDENHKSDTKIFSKIFTFNGSLKKNSIISVVIYDYEGLSKDTIITPLNLGAHSLTIPLVSDSLKAVEIQSRLKDMGEGWVIFDK